jgi:hypothetical protein
MLTTLSQPWTKRKDSVEYRHTQFGTVIVSLMGAPVFAISVHFLVAGSIGTAEAILAVMLLVTLFLFPSLTVTITDGTLTCSYGTGLIRKRIELSNIREARSVNNRWIVGWGIRWVPGQYWMWNVSGLQAVELNFNNGRRFRVGTDEPEILVRAIQLQNTSIARTN